MKLWMVNHFAISPAESGGTRHYSLARELKNHGIDTSIIAASSHYQTRAERVLPEGVPAHAEEINGVRFLWLRSRIYGVDALSRLLSMMNFGRKIALNLPGRYLEKPDVIYGSSPHLFAAAAACFLAKRKRVPFVLEIRDLWPESLIELTGHSHYHPVILVMKFLERYVYKNATRIVTLLPDAAPYFAARGAKAENVIVIPNGVDTALLEQALAAPEPHEGFEVIYAGAHGIPNQLETLIEAAAILKTRGAHSIRITMVGDGVSKPKLQQMAQQQGLNNITFLPPVPKQQVSRLLANADACYLQFKDAPLYQWGVSPNKLFDYLLAAKPVLYAANVKSNPVVAENAGIGLKPGDAEGLANAMQQLAAMPAAERAAMGSRGRTYVLAHHNFSTLGKKLADTLKGLA